MVSGLLVSFLFLIALYGQYTKTVWAARLVTVLAGFDVVGEFYAQDTLIIDITLSFVVAIIILLIVYINRWTAQHPVK